MLNLKETLAADIAAGVTAAQAAGDLPAARVTVVVERLTASEARKQGDNEAGRGDYASPVALALAKSMKKKPIDIAQAIVLHMPHKEYVGRLSVAEPGFLNIWLSTGWLTARLDNVIEQELCSDIASGEGKSVNLEFISANPTGPLTLGNARTAFTADTLGNVLTCAGYSVIREYYINDFGGQIRQLGESVVRRILQARGEDIEYPEELYQGTYIHAIADRIAERWAEDEGKEFTQDDLNDADILAVAGDEAAAAIFEGIKQDIKDTLKIDFDVWTSEKKLRENGLVDEAYQKLAASKLVYTKDGAKYLRLGEAQSEDDPVIVKQNGDYTYIVPDIANHLYKFSRKFDQILTFLGADHKTHADRTRAAMQALGQDVEKLTFVLAQWMSVVRKGEQIKMSKRKGALYAPHDLIDEVGYDAARFLMVQHALTSHMDFDLDLAKERSERNPVYYVQYGYVRLQSILRQAKERGVIMEVGEQFDLTDSPALTHTAELNVMRQIYRYPEVITEITASYDVHALAYYALDLAKAVHVFYRNVSVLGTEEVTVKRSRLQLVLAARKVLGGVLDHLGVSRPDVM